MGQKVHPYGFRLGYNKNWQSRWFSKKEYASFVFEDHNIRTYVKKLLYSAGVAKIEIERFGGRIRLILSTARPGIVIGRKGAEIEKLRADLKKKFGRDFALEVNEIRRPEIEAQLVAENIATQLERRVAFRRAMKRTVQMARKFGAEGIIYEQMKYCDFWGFERALVSHIMSEEYGWPVLSIDRLYNAKGSGQLRTRFQAFVESVELKKIQEVK